MKPHSYLPGARLHGLRYAFSAVFLGALVAALAPAQAPSDKDAVDPDHAAKMTKGLAIFKQHVRPVFVKSCLKCHGGKDTEGELDLSDRPELLRGGTSGPAVLPGKGRDSLLTKLVMHVKEPHMPFNSKKLPDDVIAHLVAWIDCGAPYDEPLVQGKKAGADWTRKVVAEEARQHWAFQPLGRAEPPRVRNAAWGRTVIDRFILRKLEKEGLAPNPAVDRRVLIRRAHFDLLGLPPPLAEVEAFVNDPDPDAYPRLVDRLLASPHYGERWGRHWLDLARFAESHGFEHDYDRPSAYHYRDFVIRALNLDLPYHTFVRWQIAGDEYEPENNLALTATGFLAAGVHSTQITRNEVAKHRYDELDDKLATVSTAMLGLTIGCARCHDHKYDPVPQADYYRLLSTFTTTVRSEVFLNVDPDGARRARAAFEAEYEARAAALRKFELAGTEAASESEEQKLRQAVVQHYTKPPPSLLVKALIATEGLSAVRLHTQGEDILKETHFLRRGDTALKEGVAAQGFLQVLMASPEREKHWQTPPPPGARTSFRRRALADWLTDVDHGAGALLARVLVNRLWQHHLGRGLVATPSDFGTRGEKPSHPELLDWLAARLIQEGWRLKPIHKLIMTSSVYMQGGGLNETNARADSENRLFWRRPARRLEAEVIRDALLAVSGELDLRMGGPGTLDPASKRRSIYFTVKRSKLVPMMQVFDAPDALGGVGQRPTTTIAPQALYLMNNPQVRGYARAFAKGIMPDANAPPAKIIRAAYLTALARPPSAAEEADALAFLRDQAESYRAEGIGDGREASLADFCQTLVCLNEFVYVD